MSPPRPVTTLDVAFVTETYPPEHGGTAMVVGEFVRELTAHGHRVTLFRPRQRHETGARARDASIQTRWVTSLPFPFDSSLRFGVPPPGRFRRELARAKPDIVHVATQGPLGWAAAQAARDLGIPLSTSFHTNFHAFAPHYGLRWLTPLVEHYLSAFHRRADCTLVPSADVARQMRAWNVENTVLVARGVDQALFHPVRRTDELRRAWGAGSGTLVLLHVGRLAPEKNIPLAFATFDAVRARGIDARLVLAGDGPLRRRWERLRTDVHFAGQLDRHELGRYYASADLLLMPSLAETFGNVVLEALASGLAVVAFRRAAAAQLLANERGGRAVPEHDARAFVEAAVSLALDAELRRRCSREATELVRDMTWAAVGDRLSRTLLAVARRERLTDGAWTEA